MPRAPNPGVSCLKPSKQLREHAQPNLFCVDVGFTSKQNTDFTVQKKFMPFWFGLVWIGLFVFN
jgi:hypothetical protein